MIINFSIQNFHCIKDKITLSFEATSSKDLEEYYVIEPKPGLRLLKLGLIYGANASGKTTVLKALEFLREMVLESSVDKTETFDFQPFLFDKNTVKGNSYLSLEFLANQTKYLLEIEFNRDAIVTEKLHYYKPNKALVYKRFTDEKKQLSVIEFGSKIKTTKVRRMALEANTLWNNTVLGGYLKTNIESKELQDVVEWFDDNLDVLLVPQDDFQVWVSRRLHSNESNKSNIVKFLKKADFNINDVVIEKEKGFFSDSYRVSFLHYIKEDTSHYTLPYEEESQGTQRYYQFSGLLDEMIREEKIQPIDELASSLHPDLLRHFLLTFLVNSKKSQLIATTHYRELLMEKDMFRNDVIWFTEKKEDGGTDLYSLADFDSSVIRNTSSIYNAYKIGKLGAVPNLSDYYIELEDVEA